jgi:hypothetical protein
MNTYLTDLASMQHCVSSTLAHSGFNDRYALQMREIRT